MSEDAVNNEKITTRSLIKQYFVRWRLLVLAAALVAIAVLLWAHTVPLQYTGTAILERRKDPASIEVSSRGSETFRGRKLTIKDDLTGWKAVVKAVENLELTKGMERDKEGHFTDKGQSAMQQLVNEFIKRIKFKWIVDSDQIDQVSVSFTHSDQELAEQMPNMLLQNYIEKVSKEAADRLKGSKDFLELQVGKCDSTLKKFHWEKIQFERDNAGILPDNAGVLQERIAQITSDLDTVRLQNEVAEQELVSLQGLEQSMTGSAEDPNEPQEIHMIPNPELARLDEELRQTKEILDEMLYVKTMKENHPTVQMLQRKIERLKERIKEIKETEPMVVAIQVLGRSANIPALTIQLLRTKATVEGTKREKEHLENRRKVYESLLNDFGAKRRTYQEITNKIDKVQAELNRWEERLTAVIMALASEVTENYSSTHLNVMQASMKQYRPSEPDLWKVFGIAVMGGLAFGGALVFLAIRMDQSVITPEQAAKGFGIPVYGFVSVIMTPRKLFFRFLKRWVVLPMVSLILIAVLGLLTYSLTLRLHYPEEYEKQIERRVDNVKSEAKHIWWNVKEKLPNPFD